MIPLYGVNKGGEPSMTSHSFRNSSKTIGIIGGVGPGSTIEYYRLIIKRFRELDKTGNYPSILLNSINLAEVIRYLNGKEYDALTKYLTNEIRKLQQGGADVGIIAANSPHIIFDRLKDDVDLPLISIVEETCKAVRKEGLSRVVLLGPRFTMQGGFYENVASRFGIEILTPTVRDQDYIHDKYMNELIAGIFKEDTKQRLMEIIVALEKTANIKGVILGGTELPLIIKQQHAPRLKIFDTTEIHIEALMNYLFS